MSNSLISVCIPTYNGAKYIVAALKSISEQTYSNLEIIVSDDDSIDDTLELINKYKLESKFPIHIYHHTPSGIGANWNHCIKQANGVYIKFLFQDDLLEPSCIADMVQVFQENSNIGLVCCKRNVLIESETDVEIAKKWMRVYGDLQNHLDLNYNPIGIITRHFFKSNKFYKKPINVVGEPSAVMFRHDLLDTMGYFREDMTQCLDFEYWYRILKKKDIAVIDKKLISFRIHADQATQQNKGKMQRDVAIFKKLLYTDYFWLLHKNQQKKLFLRHHPVGKLIEKYR